MNTRFRSAKNHEKFICAAISIFVFLVIWQLVVSFTKAGLVLAGPVETLSAFFVAIVDPIGTHTIEGHILWSLSRVLVGLVLGSACGIILGILMGWFKPFSALVRPCLSCCARFLRSPGFPCPSSGLVWVKPPSTS